MPAAGVVASQIQYPLVYPASPVAYHFDASAASSLVVDGSSQVTTWHDVRGGTNYRMYVWGQGDGNGHPNIKRGLVTQNGLNVVSFAGSVLMYNNASPKISEVTQTIFAVARSNTGNQRCWMSAWNAYALTHGGETGYISGWGVLVQGREWYVPTTALLNTFNLQTMTVDNKYLALYRNDIYVGGKAVDPQVASGELLFGGDFVATTPCDIAEVICVNGTVTLAERLAIDVYLRNKWKLPQ